MYKPLVIPSKNFFEFFLCTIGVYVMSKVVFPPNEPPPSFPFFFVKDKEDLEK